TENENKDTENDTKKHQYQKNAPPINDDIDKPAKEKQIPVPLTIAISERTKAPTNNDITIPENNDPKARRP
ncbi:45064_t:CDS:2, partial [Gigaspora margarita]